QITLASYLRKLLDRMPVPSQATFVIRRESDLPVLVPQYEDRGRPPPNWVVEITTGNFAARHKETIAYPVADLVTPVPNSFNQSAVQAVGSVLGQFGQAGLFGQGGQLGQIGQLGALGQIGQLGALGQIGQLGALGQIGQLGAL